MLKLEVDGTTYYVEAECFGQDDGISFIYFCPVDDEFGKAPNVIHFKKPFYLYIATLSRLNDIVRKAIKDGKRFVEIDDPVLYLIGEEV